MENLENSTYSSKRLLALQKILNLSGNSTLLQSFEVSYHVLAHLNGATIKEDVLTFNNDETESFLEKHLVLISECFWTFYSGIKNTSLYSQQCW